MSIRECDLCVNGPTAKCRASLKCIALLTAPVESPINLLLSKDSHTATKAKHVSQFYM